MKAYKKIISFILTLVMMLSLSVNVFAAEPLTDDERKCFISYYYYTKTIAVIAEETGLKESTVKSKLLRGRKKLKLKMEKKGFRYEDCKIFFE